MIMMYLMLLFLYTGNSPISYSKYCGNDVYGYLLEFEKDEVRLYKANYLHDDAIYNEEVLLSKYTYQDSLVVIGNYRLKVLDDKRLEVISLKGLKKGTILYCAQQNYPNGKLKFMGGWKDGKQNGVSFYLDPKGIVTKVTYRLGNEIERIENPPLEPLLKDILSRTWTRQKLGSF